MHSKTLCSTILVLIGMFHHFSYTLANTPQIAHGRSLPPQLERYQPPAVDKAKNILETSKLYPGIKHLFTQIAAWIEQRNDLTPRGTQQRTTDQAFENRPGPNSTTSYRPTPIPPHKQLGALLSHQLQKSDVGNNTKFVAGRQASEVVEYDPTTGKLSIRHLSPQEPLPISDSWASGEKYRITDVIGRGGFGKVRKLEIYDQDQHVQSYVVKIFHHRHPLLTRKLQRNIKLLDSLNHPTVVKTLAHFKDIKGHTVLIQEYGGENLIDHLPNTFGAYVSISRQLLEGIHYLHSRNLAHYDIKIDNTLINSAGEIKIIDMDDLGRPRPTRPKRHNTFPLGPYDGKPFTLGYAGPERLHNHPMPTNASQDLLKCDVYAAAVSMLQMRLGGISLHRIYRETLAKVQPKWAWNYQGYRLDAYPAGMQQFHQHLGKYLQQQGLYRQEIEFFLRMMEPRLTKRYSIQQALRHFHGIYTAHRPTTKPTELPESPANIQELTSTHSQKLKTSTNSFVEASTPSMTDIP
ncbi:MAG: protein kinase family protein [Zetaproteobacteria bacterium]|nr:protein kinase family protein [Zetaproteobacteria bacterium]